MEPLGFIMVLSFNIHWGFLSKSWGSPFHPLRVGIFRDMFRDFFSSSELGDPPFMEPPHISSENL